jgi:hypothetical protein
MGGWEVKAKQWPLHLRRRANYRDADKSLARPGRKRLTGHLQKKLTNLGFQRLDHTPYGKDLAPSDYHLFPGLKKTIEREVGRAKVLSTPLYVLTFI